METASTPSHISEGKLPPEEEKEWFLCGLQMGQPGLEVGVTPSFGGPVSPHKEAEAKEGQDSGHEGGII